MIATDKKRNYPKGRKMPEDWKMGTRNPRAKLDWLKVFEIRNSPRGRGRTKELSLKFGVSRSLIRHIWSGKYWNFKKSKSNENKGETK